MGLFGNTKPEGRTVLLLDVENGSIGSALLHIQEGKKAKLFGEGRHTLRVLPTRDSHALLSEVAGGIKHALAHIAELAAGLRQHDAARGMGEITRASIYVGAPWGQPDLSASTPKFVGRLQDMVAHDLDAVGIDSHSFFTAAGGVLGGARRALPHDDSYLLCIVGAEITELLLVHHGIATGYATMPTGTHTLVRTLKAHGATEHQARSAAKLGGGGFEDPLSAAAEHFASHFTDIAAELLRQSPVERVWVVARGSEAEWYAKALATAKNLAALFPRGGEVRVLRPSYIAPHLDVHAHEPDLALGLHALHAEML